MDLNKFAQKIARKEGKRIQVNIAQIKEVLKITLKLLKDISLKDLINLLKRSK